MKYPAPLLQLIRELGKLPGIGPKSAQRLAFHLFHQETEEVEALAQALLQAKHNLRQCERCFNVSDKPLCSVCDDPVRNTSLLCVVEQSADVLAIERSGEYQGLYHVLHGALSPMNGIGPEQLTIAALLERLNNIDEVILATSTTVEGEATAMYIARLLAEQHIAGSRIAYGLPVGGDLEYADEVTLGRAISYRRRL